MTTHPRSLKMPDSIASQMSSMASARDILLVHFASKTAMAAKEPEPIVT